MKKTILTTLIGALMMFSAEAAVITFTGGTATDANNNTHVTTQNGIYFNIVSYVESGFQLNYVSSTGDYSPQTVGSYYYGSDNDVIHGHWVSGLESIDIHSINGSTFDLNYFIITSNTQHGGAPASGHEHIYVQGYRNGAAVTAPYMLPSEDWGIGEVSNIILNNEFDNIDLFRIYGEGAFCFGMDAFYINEAAPNVEGVIIGQPVIPEVSTSMLLPLGLAALLIVRRRN
jgi:hypothetical protein